MPETTITTQLNCTAREIARCNVCDEGAGVFTHQRLGRVCTPCARAAQQIVAAFDAAAGRKRNDFLGQLRQMVIDRRAGAEVPTFYEVEIA